MGELTGAQYEQLVNALVDAFFTPNKLARMVKFKMGDNLAAVVQNGPLPDMAFDLIQYYEAQGKALKLITGAYLANPENPQMHKIAEQFGLTPGSGEGGRELERVITTLKAFIDPEPWRKSMGAAEPKICRIEITTNSGPVYGTGFLVGPEVVITNYHVVEAVIAGAAGHATASGLRAQPDQVALLFDFKKQADGLTLNAGTTYRLAATDWLIDSSPASVLDTTPPPRATEPAADELDYALLRVQGRPGDERLSGPGEQGDPVRGFLAPVTTYDYTADRPLLILQHPDREPLKFAYASDGIKQLNAPKTRLTHRVDTVGGSSGSPCFDAQWNLIGLHHAGDPNFAPDHKPTFNEAIPFPAILQLLAQHGRAQALG